MGNNGLSGYEFADWGLQHLEDELVADGTKFVFIALKAG
jgi:hypothetical protein